MLGLPIYLLGSSYYLHTRVNGRQIKRSLQTSYKRLAIIRAITLMDSLMRKCRIPDDCIDPKRYPLFMGRAVMQELIIRLKSKANLQTEKLN